MSPRRPNRARSTPDEYAPPANWRSLLILAKYLWPQNRPDIQRRVVLSLLALGIAKIATVLIPYTYKYAVDHLSAPIIVSVPIMLIVAYGSTRVISQLMNELRDGIFERAGKFAMRHVALDLFDHLHHMSLKFHLTRQTGGLSRTIDRGAQGVQSVLSLALFNAIPTLIEVALVTTILAVQFGWAYAACTLLTIALYVSYTLVLSEWRSHLRLKFNQADSEANFRAVDSLLNYETVKYFNNEWLERNRYNDALKQYEDAAVKSQVSLSWLNMGQGVIISLGLIGVMGLAGAGVVNGTRTVGDFVMVNTFLIQLYMPLNYLGFIYRQVKQSMIDIGALFHLMTIQSDVTDSPNATPLTVTLPSVEFNEVTFAYDRRKPILKGVSFMVEPGKSLAIVGQSGAGKSTITRLLYRFYDWDEGDIQIDGQSLRSVTQESVRKLIGIVPQDTVLFNDTILYNLQYGCPTATLDEIVQAAKLAKIHDFVMSLPEQYQALVGERGLKLSGGEKQRIAIARAILKNPPILILDEATSALDTATERTIQDAISEVAANRTSIIIAHRLSTIIHADQIVVMDSGRVVEVGTHHQLIESNGRYATLWNQQKGQSQ